jgi:hypothetical protein
MGKEAPGLHRLETKSYFWTFWAFSLAFSFGFLAFWLFACLFLLTLEAFEFLNF